MDYQEYYNARDLIEQIMKEDLLGPVEEKELLTETPVGYYLLGKLYPRNIAHIDEEECYVEAEENIFTEEEFLALGNGQYPSAMGITFAVSKCTNSFGISVGAAYYTPGESDQTWTRNTVEQQTLFRVEDLRKTPVMSVTIHDKLDLQIHLYDYSQLDSYKITATIVNNSSSDNYSYTTLSKATYFQPHLSVNNLQGGMFCELRQLNLNSDDVEMLNMELLYFESKSYAVGHGCSASWVSDDQGLITQISLEVIPEYELLQMRPSLRFQGELLSMKHLATASYETFREELSDFVSQYHAWIISQECRLTELPTELHQVGKDNLAKCSHAAKRLHDSILVLKDPLAFRAFALANETMFYQRKNTCPGISDSDITWYPFQLAFFLQELASITDPKGEDRSLVDLLWFPTGGGKTEAYLGIAAFTLFYRRLREMSQHRDDQGVAVIMRYTLRLLSLQQFERASAMICAAEILRQQNHIPGKAFSIGLWAGKDLTPNSLKDADAYLSRRKRTEIANPVQITRCPWCGTALNEENYHVDPSAQRMIIRCANHSCAFTQGLPIHLIDEDIYANKPSFLIGTIDKFARIAFVEEAGELLGVDLPQPPELIIQDELHLISGPLGTITGLYEAAISKICERDGTKPKVIASTATIRNADQQILALYGTCHEQFPPSGLSIKDSFFAEMSDRDSKASRKYKGYLATGSSRAVTFIRIAGSLLFASRYLSEAGYSDEVVDSFWTETGYFNTLRELGSALVRIIDNVQERFQYLKDTKFVNKYPIRHGKPRYSQIYELTSRRSSADLGTAIQEVLMKPYKSNQVTTPLDFLIASNMISVGVDVPRLNNMLVVRQPLKTSEYIQSTSRVGRSTPGLVMVIYHPTLSRDRSHYESFVPYHSTLYKQVEATSLTPFADRARDRALQALYIILARYYVPVLRSSKGASHFRRTLPGLDMVRDYIYSYVKKVDALEEENVREEIEQLEIEWEDRASHSNTLVYSDYQYSENSLFAPDYTEGSRFRMMNSMRSVEPSVSITTIE